MKILWVVMLLVGIWFIASAATENGLLPSGHGTGRLSEVLVGVALLAYAAFRLWRTFHPASASGTSTDAR